MFPISSVVLIHIPFSCPSKFSCFLRVLDISWLKTYGEHFHVDLKELHYSELGSTLVTKTCKRVLDRENVSKER